MRTRITPETETYGIFDDGEGRGNLYLINDAICLIVATSRKEAIQIARDQGKLDKSWFGYYAKPVDKEYHIIRTKWRTRVGKRGHFK